jgi:hypothetical protein
MDAAASRVRLALLLEHFADLGDDRAAWRVASPIHEVLLRVTCATIASCDFRDIVDWGEQHLRACPKINESECSERQMWDSQDGENTISCGDD